MENYGNDLFLSQEGYPSIDFTLLNRPSESIASAPESTASLLPDSSFPSFDFFVGAGVEPFGETSFRDQASFRPDLCKDIDTRFRRERPGQPNTVNVQRQKGGDAESELSPSRFQLPFGMERPMSNVDFFSVKESGNNEPRSRISPYGSNGSDQVRDFFEQEHMSQQQQSRAGNWSVLANSWASITNQSNQSQLSYHGAYNSDGVEGRNFIPAKDDRSVYSGNTLFTQRIPRNEVGPTSAHSFLPVASDPRDGRESSQMSGLRNQQDTFISTAIRSQPRSHPFNFEGVLNGSLTNQLKPSHATPFNSGSLTEQHVGDINNLGTQDAIGGLLQNHNFRFAGQNLEGAAQMQVPLNQDFLAGQPFFKGQGQGAPVHQSAGIGKQIWHGDKQLWQQQSVYAQQLEDLHCQQQAQQFKQHSQHSREQQFQQIFSGQKQNRETSYTSLLHGSPSQEFSDSIETDAEEVPIGLENYGGAFLAGNFPNSNPAGSGWCLSGSSSFQGLPNDFQTGRDQNLHWQLLALKGSQLDPSLYGTAVGTARDSTGKLLPFYPASQPEPYEGAEKLSTNMLEKPVPQNLASGSLITTDIHTDLIGTGDAQINGMNSKQQAFGKPLFGQSLQESISHIAEQNEVMKNIHQMNQPLRGPLQFQEAQLKRQRNWIDAVQKGDSHVHRLTPSSNMEETLPQSFLNGYSAQQSMWQNVNAHQSVNISDARSQKIDSTQLLQQSSNQLGRPQFLISGSKEQSGCSTLQAGASMLNSNEDGEQQPADFWNSLHPHQIQTESGSAFQLLASSNHSTLHNNGNCQSSPINSSFHLSNDSDGQAGIHYTDNKWQDSSKVEGPWPDALAGDSSGGDQTCFDSFAGLRARQDEEWKRGIVHDERIKSGNAFQSVMQIDNRPQSSWKNYTAYQSAAGTDMGFRLSDVNDRLHSNTWIQNSQPQDSEAGTGFRVSDFGSNQQDGWSKQEPQESQRMGSRLLAQVDTGQEPAFSRNRKIVTFAVTTTENSKRIQNTDQETGSRHTLLSNHIGQENSQADLNLQQEHLHGGDFPLSVETDSRQSGEQSGFNNQPNSEWTGQDFQLASSLSENDTLQRDDCPVQGSLVDRIISVNSKMAGGINSSRVCHTDVLQQSTRICQDSPAGSSQEGKKSFLQSLSNPNLRVQSRLGKLNTELVEISSNEFPLPENFLRTTGPTPLLHQQTKGSFTVEGTSMSEAHMKKSYGVGMGNAKLSAENLHPPTSLKTGKDLSYSKSAVNLTPSIDTRFLKGISASGLVSASLAMSDRDIVSSGVNMGSANKASSLSWSMPELLNSSGQSREKLVLHRGFLDHGEASTSDISLSHFRHSHSSSPLLSQSMGLGLAPPSHLSQNFQQGFSPNSGNHMFVQGSEGQVLTSDNIGKNQAPRVQPGCSENCEEIVRMDRIEADQEGGTVLSVNDAVTQNPSALAEQTCSLPLLMFKDCLEPQHPSSSNLSGGQSSLVVSVKDVQSAGSTHLMIPCKNVKAAGAFYRESGVEASFPSSAMHLSQMGVECRGFLQDKYWADRMALQSSSSNIHPSPNQLRCSEQNSTEPQIINMTMHQLSENQAADFSRLPMSSACSQQRLSTGNDKAFSKVFKSFHPLPSGKSGTASQFSLDPQINIGKSSTRGKIPVAGLNQLFWPSSSGHSFLHEPTNQSRIHPELSPDDGLNPMTLQSKHQEQIRPVGLAPSLLPVHSGASSLQASCPGPGREELRGSLVYEHPAFLNASTRMFHQRGIQVQEAKRLSTEKSLPFSVAQGGPGQQTDTSSEALSVSQTSDSLSLSDTVLSSQPAVRAAAKTDVASGNLFKNTSISGFVNNNKMSSSGKLSQHQHPPFGMGQSKSSPNSEGMQLRGIITSESSLETLHNHLQAVDMFRHSHGQLQNQTLSSLFGMPSQIPSIAKGTPPAYASAESLPSLAYAGKHVIDQLSASQATYYKNLNAARRAQVLSSQQLMGRIPAQLLSGADASSHFPGSIAKIFLKDGESRLLAQNAATVMEHISQQGSVLRAPGMVLPMKRKKEVPPTIPWHVALMQGGGRLLSTSGTEWIWAAATNRLAEKDDDEADGQDEGAIGVVRAKRRLKLTTQLTQHLILPLPAALMQGNTVVDYECAAYMLAKMALEDSCRLVANEAGHAMEKGRDGGNMASELHQKPEPSNHMRGYRMSRLVEGFLEKARQLDGVLLRLEGSISAVELKCETYGLEKISTVNRLAKYHGKGFPLEFPQNDILEEVSSESGPGMRRPIPQKYVTAVPMPRTLPEGVICFSL